MDSFRHLKMKNEEVERIFRVASESFRTKWEVQRNGGQSLIELKTARETALVQEKQYQRKSKIWIYIMLACIPLVLFIQSHLQSYLKNYKADLSILGVFLCIFIPSVAMHNKAHKNRFEQVDEVDRIDKILEQFAQSLSALNPLGTGNSYHDVVDASYVEDRAIALAVRVVDAETKFDALRYNPEASRDEVTDAGEYIKKCKALLERFESNLNSDFGQSLDRSSIFKAAEAHLAKTRPKK